MPNEADTCRRYVVPKLQAAGWDDEPHRLNEQVTFTDGRIVVDGRRGRRRPGKRADYLLRYRPDLPIAVVEALHPRARLQRACRSANVRQQLVAFSVNWRAVPDSTSMPKDKRPLLEAEQNVRFMRARQGMVIYVPQEVMAHATRSRQTYIVTLNPAAAGYTIVVALRLCRRTASDQLPNC